MGEVESVTGRTVTRTGLVPDERMHPPADGPNPCEYVVGGKHASIAVFVVPGGAAEFYRERQRDPVNTDAIEGVGDDAFASGLAVLNVLAEGQYVAFATQHGAGWDGIEDLKRLAHAALDPRDPGPSGP